MSQALLRTVPKRIATRFPSQSQPAQRRFLATEETPVSWSEYRSGEKSLQQWVEANRHKVAGGFFVFYVGLAAWNLRSRKGEVEQGGE